jgi:hypothetical protein
MATTFKEYMDKLPKERREAIEKRGAELIEEERLRRSRGKIDGPASRRTKRQLGNGEST